MAVDIDTLLQKPVFDFWSVPCTFVPKVSQPTVASYLSRGIFNTYELDIAGLDNSIISDQRTIFDIRQAEFLVLPLQGDHVIIPFDCNGQPLGEYEILDADSDGGGQICLTIRKWEGPPSNVTMVARSQPRMRSKWRIG